MRRLVGGADPDQPGGDGEHRGGRVAERVEHRLTALDADPEEGRVQDERRQPALGAQEEGGLVAQEGGHRRLPVPSGGTSSCAAPGTDPGPTRPGSGLPGLTGSTLSGLTGSTLTTCHGGCAVSRARSRTSERDAGTVSRTVPGAVSSTDAARRTASVGGAVSGGPWTSTRTCGPSGVGAAVRGRRPRAPLLPPCTSRPPPRRAVVGRGRRTPPLPRPRCVRRRRVRVRRGRRRRGRSRPRRGRGGPARRAGPARRRPSGCCPWTAPPSAYRRTRRLPSRSSHAPAARAAAGRARPWTAPRWVR